jgi:hypothetical protein
MEAAEKGGWDLANKRKLFVLKNRSEHSPVSSVDIWILFYLLFISCFFAFLMHVGCRIHFYILTEIWVCPFEGNAIVICFFLIEKHKLLPENYEPFAVEVQSELSFSANQCEKWSPFRPSLGTPAEEKKVLILQRNNEKTGSVFKRTYIKKLFQDPWCDPENPKIIRFEGE